MKRKKVLNYVDEGFGFPVIFREIELIEIDGQWTPDIDYRQYEETLLHAMPEKPVRLTGNEVKFIRLHFGMTLEEFGARFNRTRQGVMKWEATGNRSSKMAWSSEKDIRLFVLEKTGARDAKFRCVYSSLAQERSPENKRIILRRGAGSSRAKRFAASYA